ncbi:hypothetical protein MFLO_07147 [Listeria floridensis FSL S10-1187]|uniref:Bacterial Ig domain-containing protein n=1 Tax=Listeria floridensis FSL S10-1187 TaxID=1265817 RepID=A0ABN0RFW5_9LIST|nr:immunoglobulin-like domain-containing protein [Listeria floridensis]EUJ32300.1 hypothetical protein MFLO_07147 [Listeria floridensis FSL S10-1187]
MKNRRKRSYFWCGVVGLGLFISPLGYVEKAQAFEQSVPSKEMKQEERGKAVVATNESKGWNVIIKVNPYQTGDVTLSGSVSKGIRKVRLWVDGEVKTQANVDAEGNYVFENSDRFIASVEDKVEVVGVDSSYIERGRQEVSIEEGSWIYGLTVDPYTYNDTILTGTKEKNIAKVRLFVNDVICQQATIKDGKYRFTNVQAFVRNKTDKVEIVGVDGRYVRQAQELVSIQKEADSDYELSLFDYQLGDASGKRGSWTWDKNHWARS